MIVFDYIGTDIESRNKVVIEETRDRAVAEEIVKKRKDSSCEVYYEIEQDGKLYRVLCDRTTVKSDWE